MTFIDLTHIIDNDIKEFPEDPKTEIKRLNIDDCVLSSYSTSLHTGTHIDSPFHYFYDKKISDYSVDSFIGITTVINTSQKIINSTENLEEIVIINTGNSKYWGKDEYFMDYPYLSIDFAKRLVSENVKGVAIDTCSVDKIGENKIHNILLENNIWIAENINSYGKLNDKKYKGYFIPIKIKAEASQIRAFVKRI
ncbi:MAG: cyclase family protein [Methanobrevibacter sp.]|nr:cyclase family protein [Methanobrevibacter sp.]